MQQRKGTAAQWTASNPILNSGEIGYESDTNKFKIGDGTNLWATLPYFLDEDTIGTSLNGYLEDTLLGAANGVAQLNSSGKLVSDQIPNVDEITQDAINTALVAGTGLDKTYNDNANTITIDIDSTVATKTYVDDAIGSFEALPSQTSNTGKFLTTDGSATSWATVDLSSKQDKVTGVSDTEIGYLDGVTSAIQTQLDAKSTASKTETLTNKTLTSPTINGATVGGHIVPSTDNTYDLGSPTQMWKDIYVGPGSLYVNGQKVLQDESGAIVVSADINENLGLRTSGSGNIELDPTGTGVVNVKGPLVIQAATNITSADGNAVTFGGAVNADSISSKTANTDLSITANGTGKVYLNDNAEVSGNLVVGGNLTVSGTTTTVNSETISLADNLIDLNSNFTTGTPTENAGIRIMRGDSSAVQFRWNESSDVWEFTTDGTTYNSVLSINDTALTTALGAKLASSTAATTYAPLASPTFTGTVTLPSGTVTSTMIADGTIVDADIDASAAIALSKLATDPLARANHTGSQVASTISDFNEAAQDAIGTILGTGLSYNDAGPGIGINNAALSDYLLDGVSGSSYGLIGTSAYLDIKNTNGYNKEIELDIAAVETKLETDGFAKLASPALTGTPTAPTATAGTNSTQVATTAYADAAVAALVDAAPGTLNTLNELAAAINDDASYASTITTALGLKAPLASPTFTGTVDVSGATVTGLPAATFVQMTLVSVSSNITLEANKRYFVDTAAARTLTLPASPALGNEIQIFDVTGTAATNNITIASNSLKINGTVQDLEVDINNDVTVLVYTGSTYGWTVI
jgi:hypothetical protein